MSAFVFGSPLSLTKTPSRALVTQTRSTFVNPLSDHPTTPSTTPKTQCRNLSMTLSRPRRHRGGMSLWGPTGDMMFPERMMSKFFEPLNDLVSIMGDDSLLEMDDTYQIKMIMPGISKEDIKVDVRGGVLSIRVEKKEEEEKKEGAEAGVTDQVEWVRKQMQRVQKSWRMPDNADLSNIKAVTKDGVLTVTVPKTDKSEPSKVIDVEGE